MIYYLTKCVNIIYRWCFCCIFQKYSWPDGAADRVLEVLEEKPFFHLKVRTNNPTGESIISVQLFFLIEGIV